MGDSAKENFVSYNFDGSQYRPKSAAGRYGRNVVSKSVQSSAVERSNEG